MTLTAQRGASCPSAFELEAFIAGETTALATHIGGCEACGAYVSALRAEQDRFMRARPAELFLGQVERRAAQPPRRSWSLWVLAPLLAGAAAIVTFVALPHRGEDVALKGSPFKVLVKRGDGAPEHVLSDATLRQGDALRFSFDVPRDGELAILDLDGTERVTTFYPPQGTRSTSVRAGAAPLLPGATVLDDAPGPEWLIAVFSDQAFETADLAAQLKGQSRRPALELKCAGCQIFTLRFEKAAR
jgi:hypothetical protein